MGHDLKFESTGGNDAGSSFSASRRDATRRMSATELVCAAPSQQRLRRSSVAAALRAASAPSQQHQLRRGRDAQNERDGAGLSSDSVAAPSQQRCAHHERSTGQWAEQHLGKICHFWAKRKTGVPTNLVVQHINLPKELRPLPCSRIFFWGVILFLKELCLGSDPQNSRRFPCERQSR